MSFQPTAPMLSSSWWTFVAPMITDVTGGVWSSHLSATWATDLPPARTTQLPLHPAGRSISSDRFVNSFIMVVFANIFSRPLDTKFRLNWKQAFSLTTIIKLFTNQSELIDLPAGYFGKQFSILFIPAKDLDFGWKRLKQQLEKFPCLRTNWDVFD